MKKSNIVEPLSRAGFRKHILKSLSIQGAFVFALFLLKDIFQPQSLFEFSILNSLLLCVINLTFIRFVYTPKKYVSRFKDIYPRYDLDERIVFLFGLMPAIFMIFTAFLCFKERDERFLPFNIFRPRYVALTVALVFGIQTIFPVTSYWFGTPTISYIINTVHQVNRVLKFKDEGQVGTNVFSEYMKQYSENLSSTELVLLTALSATHKIKEKNRILASRNEKDTDSKLQFSLGALKSFHESLVISESTRGGFLDYGPLQWLSPTGPFEIILLTSVDDNIRLRFNRAILGKSLQVVERVERKFRDSKDENDQKVLGQLKEIEQKFKSSNTYLALNEVTPN